MDESSFRIAKPRTAMLVAYKALADLAGKGSLFVITIAAARRLSPESFGIFSIGSTLGWLVAVATDFGIQMHLAREVARRPQDAAGLLRHWLRIRLWVSAAAIVIVGAGALAPAWRGAYGAPIAVFAVVYAGSGLIEFLHYFYRGLSRSDLESSLTLWQRGGTLVCGLLALAWTPDVTMLGAAMLLPVVATLAVSLRLAWRLARSSSSVVGRVLSDPATAAGPKDPPYFLRDVFPIGAGILLSALYFRIDVFLVQFWSGPEAVALYNAVFRLVEALRLFPAAVLAVTLPALCRARDVRAVAQVSASTTAFAIGVTGVLWIAGDWLIPFLYGAPYRAAVPAFRVLLLSFPLLSLNYALTTQLIAWDGQRMYAVLCGLALVVNVALNARLIPMWSIEGAAWATLGTEAFLTLGCVVGIRVLGAGYRVLGAVQGAEVQGAVRSAEVRL